VRRRSEAYCLGFDNQSRQISVRESSIVPDYVKDLEARDRIPSPLTADYPANGSFFAVAPKP
jgi:hypothetical protein